MTTEMPQGDVSAAYLNALADKVEDSIAQSFQLTLSQVDTAMALLLAANRLLLDLGIDLDTAWKQVTPALSLTHKNYFGDGCG